MSRTNFVLRTPKSILSLGTTECKEMACHPAQKKKPEISPKHFSNCPTGSMGGHWGPSRLGQPVGTPACPCGLLGSLPQHGKQLDFLVFARGPSAPSRASKHVRSRLFHRWAARFVLRKILTLPRLLLPSRPRPVPLCPSCHPRLAGMCRPASPLLAVPRAALLGTPAWMIRRARGLHAALTTMCTRLPAQMPA